MSTKGLSLIYRQCFLENDADRLFGETVSLLKMTLNAQFHEPALTVFATGYNGSRREYCRAAGALQIEHPGF